MKDTKKEPSFIGVISCTQVECSLNYVNLLLDY